jgi:hypothetical protein
MSVIIIGGKKVGIVNSTVSGVKTFQGFKRSGDIKFSLSGNKYVQEAIDAFNLYSKYGSNKVSDSKLVTEHLTYFLHAFDIVSGHEGGFDSYNTYDAGGLSLGTIQFALTSGYIGDMLNEMQSGLGDEVDKLFTNKGPFVEDIDLTNRLNKDICEKILNVSSISNSIKIQLKYVIQKFYDESYGLFLKLVKPKIKIENNNNLFVYANAFMFDMNVNRGNLGPFKEEVLATIPKDVFTEGTFIYKMSAGGKVKLNLPERDAYWNGVNPGGPFGKNFIEGTLPS